MLVVAINYPSHSAAARANSMPKFGLCTLLEQIAGGDFRDDLGVFRPNKEHQSVGLGESLIHGHEAVNLLLDMRKISCLYCK